MSADPVPPPADPALRRLLPDAYGDDEAAAEFRRLMEHDLRQQKVQALDAVAARLADVATDQTRRAVLSLDEPEAETWMQALNDARLTIGTRLDVTEDLVELFNSLPNDDPRIPLLLTYDWLGGLQDGLVRAVDE